MEQLFLLFSGISQSQKEHTAKLCKGVPLSWVHSVKVCDNNDKLDIKNSIRLPAPAMVSAIFKLVKVLPVSQAMTAYRDQRLADRIWQRLTLRFDVRVVLLEF